MKDVISIIKEQLNSDMESMNAGKPVSLLAKWMPSNNTSSKETKDTAKLITKNLGITDRQYRKMLSALRKYIDVVEVKLSSKRFGEIDYEAVPSVANLKYKNAFIRNDNERRREYLEKLSSGEAKINGAVNFPHDIVNKYGNQRIEDATLEALWKALPDYVNGQGNTICVADGSGSMITPVSRSSSVTALNVCMALSIYFSERSSGAFKDKFITFSNRPQMVDLTVCDSLVEKITRMKRYNEVANTNIEAVFDMILETAVKNNTPQEEIPNILILSDMEFDSCACTNETSSGWYKPDPIDPRLFEVISERYAKHGYKLPRMTFWNICGRTGTIPVTENNLGVALVSGFSPSIAKMVLSCKLDPLEVLLEQLNNERYDAVENAVADILK